MDWSKLYSSNNCESNFVDAVVTGGFQQLVQVPTHRQGNILDIVLTNVPNQVCNIVVNNEELISDHYMVEASIDTVFVKNPSTEEIPDYAKADFLGMNDYLLSLDWDSKIVEKDKHEAW